MAMVEGMKAATSDAAVDTATSDAAVDTATSDAAVDTACVAGTCVAATGVSATTTVGACSAVCGSAYSAAGLLSRSTRSRLGYSVQ
jgi:hypothetical protein